MKRMALVGVVTLFSFSIAAQEKKGVPTDSDFGIGDIEISGLVRVRPEVKQYTKFRKANTFNYVNQKAWLTFAKKFDDTTKVVVRIQDGRIWGGQSRSISAADTNATTVDTTAGELRQEKGTDVREAYIDLAGFFDTPVRLQMGRQRFVYGDQRLIGHLDWSNVGRSFDAFRFKWDVEKTNSLHAFTSIVSEGNASDLNNKSANGDDRYFSGLYNTYKGLGFLNIQAYLLARNNVDHDLKERLYTGGTRITNRTEKNKTPRGTDYDYTLEGAYQFGQDDANQDIAAYAGALKLGYTLDLGFKLRVGVEGDIASGDTDPTDGKNETFNNLYHTNHALYGYVDLISWQNMIAGSVNLTAFLWKDLVVKLAYWYGQLNTVNDAWYGVGGGSSTIASANFSNMHELYHAGDFTIDYKARKYLKFGFGYSYALRGKAVIDAGGEVDYHVGYMYTQVNF